MSYILFMKTTVVWILLLLIISTFNQCAAGNTLLLPCDLFEISNTPCVAAHSVIRALYSTYNGPLYTIQRLSDNARTDIYVISKGSHANSAMQDKFCANNDCRIVKIFDQSNRANHLSLAPPGGAYPHEDIGVNATKGKTTINGTTVYGAYFEGKMGYRNDNTSGIAINDESETIYMVVDGTHFNNGCCFDYGNAETDAHDDGKGTMEAVYFGSSTGWGRGTGHGPWIMADLENGLWAGNEKVNPSNPSIQSTKIVHAMLKGKSGGSFALKGGDANDKNSFKTLYDGPRPPTYNPMKKQGAIILGIGGDNSDWAIGTFYEGCMTQGISSDETDQAIHENIVSVMYGK